MPDDIRDPRAARERLALALEDAREIVDVRTQDVRHCLERGLAWGHETVRTARSRLAAAVAEVQMLELLTRPEGTGDAGTGDAGIPPLTVRR